MAPDARLVSAIVANKKLRPDRRQTLEKCLFSSDPVGPQQPLTELVPVYPKAKKSGGVRMIHNFGLLTGQVRTMVSRVMGVYYKPRYFQFTERGVHAAVKSAKAALGAGHVHVARLDIENFIPASILRSWLPSYHFHKRWWIMSSWTAYEGRDGPGAEGQPRWLFSPPYINDLLLLARLGIPSAPPAPRSSPVTASRNSVASQGWRDVGQLCRRFPASVFERKAPRQGGWGLTAVVANPRRHFELILKATSDAMNGFDFPGIPFASSPGS